jgi:hypothetical protein
MTRRYPDEILNHYKSVWDGEVEAIKPQRGRVHELPPDYHVLRFQPGKTHRTWIYATQCMSTPGDDERLELHIRSNGQHDEAVSLLSMTAHYHRTGARLGLGHSVNFGVSWVPGSLCSRGLISLPYLDGPRLEWMKYRARPVQFLWLIPVTPPEIDYKQKHGLDALETLFEESQFNYADPRRGSVVRKE